MLVTRVAGKYIRGVSISLLSVSSSTRMSSLVNGVPNNHSRRFSTLEDAVQAYAEAVQHGNVRRMRPVIQPSGHVYV